MKPKPKRRYTAEQVEQRIQKLFTKPGKRKQAALVDIIAIHRMIGGAILVEPKNAHSEATRILKTLLENPAELLKCEAHTVQGLDTDHPTARIRMKNKPHLSTDFGVLEGGIDRNGKAYVLPGVPEWTDMKKAREALERYHAWKKAAAQRRREHGSFKRAVRMAL